MLPQHILIDPAEARNEYHPHLLLPDLRHPPVAQAMAEAFRQAGHTTQAISLKKATPHNALTGDLLGVGSPCFSSPGAR